MHVHHMLPSFPSEVPLVRPAPPKRRPPSTTKEAKRPRRGRPPRHAVDESQLAGYVIKRYGNRRMYDPQERRAVTMNDLGDLVRRGLAVRVVDGDTGADITRRMLVQVILEENQAQALELLPVDLLRAIIGVRSNQVAEWMGQYLQAGAKWLDRTMQQAQTYDPIRGMAGIWDMPTTPPPAPKPPAGPSTVKGAAADDLRDEMAELQARLAELAAKVNRR